MASFWHALGASAASPEASKRPLAKAHRSPPPTQRSAHVNLRRSRRLLRVSSRLYRRDELFWKPAPGTPRRPVGAGSAGALMAQAVGPIREAVGT